MASVVQASGASCSLYNRNWGYAPDVPVIVPSNGLCIVSASDRELSTLVCGARPSAEKRRLCLCSSPVQAPSPTPVATEPVTAAPTTEASTQAPMPVPTQAPQATPTEDCPTGFLAEEKNIKNINEVISQSVQSAANCGTKCSEQSECDAFEYVQAEQKCKLKLGYSLLGQPQVPGVISCIKEAPPSETPTLPPVPVPSGIVQVKHRHNDLCMDSPGYATSGSTLQTWACDARVAQKWSYEASTRLLRSQGGTCLYAPEGQLLFVKTCDPDDADQQWTIDTATGQLQNVHGRCAEAAGDENGAGIYMNICAASSEGQHWNLVEATEEAPVVPSWHLAAGGTTCTQACSAEGLSCDNSAFAERNTDIDSKEEMSAVVKALNAGVECTRYNTNWGTAGDVPVMVPDTGLCFVSDGSRTASTFKCNAGVPAHKRRLCLCTAVALKLIQRIV